MVSPGLKPASAAGLSVLMMIALAVMAVQGWDFARAVIPLSLLPWILILFGREDAVKCIFTTVGAVLSLCPIMRLDDKGRIIAYDKVRGKRKARERTLEMMLQHARGGADYAEKCFICHSDCVEEAAALRDLLTANFPHIKDGIRICDIGTIIASHCGPGTLGVLFIEE